MSRCVAVRCSALQCVAVCCSALQCVAACVFQFSAVDNHIIVRCGLARAVSTAILLSIFGKGLFTARILTNPKRTFPRDFSPGEPQRNLQC